jgi:hypothetical protein
MNGDVQDAEGLDCRNGELEADAASLSEMNFVAASVVGVENWVVQNDRRTGTVAWTVGEVGYAWSATY